MPQGSRRVESLSHLEDAINNKRWFLDERKGMQNPGEIENVKKKIHARVRKMLIMNRQLCLGQWQWKKKGWRQPQKIQRKRRDSRRTSQTPQGTWLSGARKDSLWLCYAGSLAGRQKRGISSKRQRPKPIS